MKNASKNALKNTIALRPVASSNGHTESAKASLADLLDSTEFDAATIQRLARERAERLTRQAADEKLFANSFELGHQIGREFFPIATEAELTAISTSMCEDHCDEDAVETALVAFQRAQQSLKPDHDFFNRNAIDEDDLFEGFRHGAASRFRNCLPMIDSLARKMIGEEEVPAALN